MIINLTKHVVNIYDGNNTEIVTVQPSGLEARIKIKTETRKVGYNGDVPLFETTILGLPYVVDQAGNEESMPSQKHGTIYIVSDIFRASFDRDDLYQVGRLVNLYQPGRLIRNGQDQPIGCVGLSR